MKITLKQLQLFVNTAKFGSISEGAKHSHITQSGASLALAELERLLGFPLFDRHGKKVHLNSEGERLLGKAITILDLATEIETLPGSSTETQGHLVLGASSTIGNYLLPIYLSKFNAQYPRIKVDCAIANTQQVINDVKQFRLDIGFIEGSCDETLIEQKIWQHDELVIFSRDNHPLSMKKSLKMSDLKDYSWALRESASGTRQIFEEKIRKFFIPTVAITLASSEALKYYVAQSDCLSCLSKCSIDTEVLSNNLKILALEDFSLHRPLYLITNKNKHQTKISCLFEEFLQKPN